MVLFRSTHPILFTYIDDDNLYICSCHYANAEKQEWIIVPANHENVIDLLTDKVTICEIFEIWGKDVVIATQKADGSEVSVKHSPLQKSIKIYCFLPGITWKQTRENLIRKSENVRPGLNQIKGLGIVLPARGAVRREFASRYCRRQNPLASAMGRCVNELLL